MSKPILVLDFDGVVHSYTSKWKDAKTITDDPTPGFFEALADYLDHFDVQIFSSRSHQDGGIRAMQEWLSYHSAFQGFGGLVHHIGFPQVKPPALVGLDDRVLTFTGVWPTVEELRAFRPWNKR